ncbi:glucose-6-phosphate isomerase [Serpentinicella alkaliphila]|uniref:Glucose-6-phosphate isomerase n=1 Tax=Serpentinicella alkaliphila TaxID=1734049 RepID=A0A4R2TMJ2_9FIRM|nr:glucose-6-phosphate isomerase [Serpentinicella alkaliphila]QUH25031.1 glucose-6-phosphate isomerase [Serpentinicella alkaliphila]TCQ02485.1 glucose-6-phosphate isomerase [Serpentinicella alkaliphila]
MEKITIDYRNVVSVLSKNDLSSMEKRIKLCHNMLHRGNGEGSNYLGWINLPSSYEQEETKKIKEVAEKIKKESDVLIVVGIGGSYLGARAAIEMLNHNFYNELPKEKRKGPKVYFAGHNISPMYIKNLLDVIGDQHISLNVISKSGTTTEPGIVFRIFKEYMENRYGKKEAMTRIYATTDRSHGALRELASQEGYETFVIPNNIGGRYSVLTPVGLLPMAVSGINIEDVLEGAKRAQADLSDDSLKTNNCYKYAALRNLLYSRGKTTEVMVTNEPNLYYMGEWYKQLFGESEGKDGKGIFPASMNFTTDLHSLGQYLQDGKKNIFETAINIEKSQEDIAISKDKLNLDGLNYLEGKTLDYINRKAMEGALAAHTDGGVPNIVINLPEITPFYYGYLTYFFMKACGMSGYLLEVNPFDQPGVEAYKRNMFRLLGKPGYEEVYEEIVATLERV